MESHFLCKDLESHIFWAKIWNHIFFQVESQSFGENRCFFSGSRALNSLDLKLKSHKFLGEKCGLLFGPERGHGGSKIGSE